MAVGESTLEDMVTNSEFWRGKRIFLSGHTGFKGGWLSLWLQHLGSDVYGYALAPATTPNLFELARVEDGLVSEIADVRDIERLKAAVIRAKPEIVFHMAAQPLVRAAYRDPVGTFSTNVMGTVNLLEAVREAPSVRAVVIVTTDKCYENREWEWGYRENDRLGGHDPYSSSKAAAELISASYRDSFFGQRDVTGRLAAIATARAGNVIGGGDWAEDRLIPDVVRSLIGGDSVQIRNPGAVRPWQHVLEPLSGYLQLAQCLYEQGEQFATAWNFGPEDVDAKTVEWVVGRLNSLFGNKKLWKKDKQHHPKETGYLKLDISRARQRLGWSPRWSLDKTLVQTVDWYRNWATGGNMRDFSLTQIREYVSGG